MDNFADLFSNDFMTNPYRLFVFLSILSLSSSCLSWTGKDLGEEAASPWTTRARTVLIGGTALTLVSLAMQDRMNSYQTEIVKDKPLGKWSKVGDIAGQWVPNVAYMLGQSISGVAGNKQGYDRALGMLKASAYSSVVTTALKYSIREPRPNNHNDRNSFPSGHSTTAFAFGGFVLAEHGWAWGAPALALSTLVGLSRINDNKHRFHDVFAGATIGMSYGMGISYLYQKKKGTETALHVMPIYDAQVKGLVAMKSF